LPPFGRRFQAPAPALIRRKRGGLVKKRQVLHRNAVAMRK
jgi:hypothetical protein